MLIDDIRNGESPTLEFKRDIPDQVVKYLKTISAFANCAGGRIVFGVDSDLSIVGMVDPFAARDKVADAIANGIEPLVVPDISFQTVDGKTLIVVQIAQGPRCPYWVKSLGRESGTFIRYDATTRLADTEVLRELAYDGCDKGFDEAQCRTLELTTRKVSSLCKLMRERAQAACETPRERRAVRPVTEEKLEEWGVLTRRGGKLVATNAFALLSGDKAFSTCVKCGIFRGTEHRKMLDRREFRGPVQDQIRAAHEWVLSKINMAAVVKGLHRHDVYEFPEEAIRELITNAVMHRNYATYGSDIQIALYDDRLEIVSPGGLPRGMTLERMKIGCSCCRNKAIAEAFAYMRVAEKWGLGVPNALKDFAEYGLGEPEYTDWGNAIRVTLKRATVEKAVIGGGKAVIERKKAVIGGEKTVIGGGKAVIGDEKVDIDPKKVDIGGEKVDIEKSDATFQGVPLATQKKIRILMSHFASVEYFKRAELLGFLGVKKTRGTELLQILRDKHFIEPVSGHGKGAYRWCFGTGMSDPV